jgi:hypothetical protein
VEELFEERFLMLDGNTRALVADFKAEKVVAVGGSFGNIFWAGLGQGAHHDFATGRRVAEGIADQIGEDQLQAIRIGEGFGQAGKYLGA